MKAKYKEKSRLLLTNNKLSEEEKIVGIHDLIDEMTAEMVKDFADMHANILSSVPAPS